MLYSSDKAITIDCEPEQQTVICDNSSRGFAKPFFSRRIFMTVQMSKFSQKASSSKKDQMAISSLPRGLRMLKFANPEKLVLALVAWTLQQRKNSKLTRLKERVTQHARRRTNYTVQGAGKRAMPKSRQKRTHIRYECFHWSYPTLGNTALQTCTLSQHCSPRWQSHLIRLSCKFVCDVLKDSVSRKERRKGATQVHSHILQAFSDTHISTHEIQARLEGSGLRRDVSVPPTHQNKRVRKTASRQSLNRNTSLLLIQVNFYQTKHL